jgi:ATP-binding cassette subfamily F protein 3
VEQIGFEAALKQKWSETAGEVAVTTSTMGVEEAERRVRALRSPVRTLPNLHLRLGSEKRSGDVVIRTKDLLVGYEAEEDRNVPRRELFKAPTIELRRQDCAALIGPNGAGKTTFLKTILGQIPPLSGEVTLGTSLHIGYFAQAHEGLDPKRTLIEEIESVAPQWQPGQIRDYLGKYLFSGDDAYKKVGMLSGGERGRLALSKLALQDTNFLLLDEPTNHLDIPSQEVLEAVLDDYEGTVLLITHDRYLVDAVATQIWEIDTEGAHLTVFKGTYSELRAERENKAYQEFMAAQKPTSKGKGPAAAPVKAAPANSKSADAKAEKKRIVKLKELETKIAALEAQLAEISETLANPPKDAGEVMRLAKEYDRVQKEMDIVMAEWETMQV